MSLEAIRASLEDASSEELDNMLIDFLNGLTEDELFEAREIMNNCLSSRLVET